MLLRLPDPDRGHHCYGGPDVCGEELCRQQHPAVHSQPQQQEEEQEAQEQGWDGEKGQLMGVAHLLAPHPQHDPHGAPAAWLPCGELAETVLCCLQPLAVQSL